MQSKLTTLKRILLIGIMLIMAYSQVGFYFVIRNSQNQQKEIIKEKILNSLNENEMQAISFTDNQQQIYWEEDGKEFFFKGEMYDVAYRKTINGKVILYCINDKKEKELIDKYNFITDHNSSSDSEVEDVTGSVDLFVYDNNKVEHPHFLLTGSEYSSLNYFLPEVFCGIVSPPPKAYTVS